MRTVLFVCTGNTCRSPMAEGLAAAYAKANKLDVFVASAGVAAVDGMPTSPETVEALHRLGIEFQGHSIPLTADMIVKADVVYCMTASHLAAAQAVLGRLEGDHAEVSDRIQLLQSSGDVGDPIGSSQKVYDALAKHLQPIIEDHMSQV